MRRPRRHLPRLRRIVAVAVLLVACSAAAAFAWTASTTNPGNSISALSLGTAGTPSAAPTPTTGPCTSVLVSWTPATNADRYRVEANSTGTWTMLAASHATTSLTDTTGYTNLTIDYRITPLLAGTSWEGAAATVSVSCGLGDIADLAATHGCNDVALTWSAPPGATRYEVWRSVNGAAAVALSTNVATPSYVDTSTYAAGDNLAYYVVPTVGGTTGSPSNTATVTGWDQFRVASVAFNDNGGTALGLAPGDQVVVTFSKPVKAGTVTGTSIYTQGGTGTRGVWLPATAAGAAAAELGGVGTVNNFFNATGAWTGTTSWNAARTTWTWTSTTTRAGIMDGALTGSWTLGTSAGRALCAADGTSTLAATAPTVSGSW